MLTKCSQIPPRLSLVVVVVVLIYILNHGSYHPFKFSHICLGLKCFFSCFLESFLVLLLKLSVVALLFVLLLLLFDFKFPNFDT